MSYTNDIEGDAAILKAMANMKLLDLFCGVGGASKGYELAGFDVYGVDIKDQPRYPYDFYKLDATQLSIEFLQQFDFIHASPPCQLFSSTFLLQAKQHRTTVQSHLRDLLPNTRTLLQESGVPYIIENVPGAPLLSSAIMICATQFNLNVNSRQLQRHRLFEPSQTLRLKGTNCYHRGKPLGVYSRLGDKIPNGGHVVQTIQEAQTIMGIDWTNKWKEIKEAIPPAYTEYIGLQIIEQL